MFRHRQRRKGTTFVLPFSVLMSSLVGEFYPSRSESSYLSACRVAGESEEPPREEEPDAIPPRAATTTLGDGETKLALVPRPEGDASAGDAHRASRAAMVEAGSGEAKRREAEQGRTAKGKKSDQPSLWRLERFVKKGPRLERVFFFSTFSFFLSTSCLLATPAAIAIRAARKREGKKNKTHSPAKKQSLNKSPKFLSQGRKKEKKFFVLRQETKEMLSLLSLSLSLSLLRHCARKTKNKQRKGEEEASSFTQ